MTDIERKFVAWKETDGVHTLNQLLAEGWAATSQVPFRGSSGSGGVLILFVRLPPEPWPR